jgi:hypothetical protein
MFGRMEVFGSMFVFGRIATTDVPAAQAQAKVNPPITYLQALFTTLAVWFDILDLVEVSTLSHSLPPCARWRRYSVESKNAHLRNFRL